jgi:hypothetical protein
VSPYLCAVGTAGNLQFRRKFLSVEVITRRFDVAIAERGKRIIVADQRLLRLSLDPPTWGG